jgi:hypothetical protein
MAIRPSTALSLLAVLVTYAATMAAIWCFGESRGLWGVYNLAIAAVGMMTFTAVHGHSRV